MIIYKVIDYNRQKILALAQTLRAEGLRSISLTPPRGFEPRSQAPEARILSRLDYGGSAFRMCSRLKKPPFGGESGREDQHISVVS